MYTDPKINISRTFNKWLICLGLIAGLLSAPLIIKAQSPVIGNDLTQINKSMKLKVTKSDLSIIIPKIKSEDLNSFREIILDQVVFITGKNSGFYVFEEDDWASIAVNQVIENINSNMELLSPDPEHIIIIASNNGSEQLLDYNSYIKQLNGLLNDNKLDNNFALQLND